MTEKKEGFKLVVTAKEFVPKSKDRKSVDKPEPAPVAGAAPTATATTEAAGPKVALNPSAKEFVPKMPGPETMGPVVYVVPTLYPIPGVVTVVGPPPETAAAPAPEGKC